MLKKETDIWSSARYRRSNAPSLAVLWCRGEKTAANLIHQRQVIICVCDTQGENQGAVFGESPPFLHNLFPVFFLSGMNSILTERIHQTEALCQIWAARWTTYCNISAVTTPPITTNGCRPLVGSDSRPIVTCEHCNQATSESSEEDGFTADATASC